MPLLADTFFQAANYVEAALWIGIGVVFWRLGVRRRRGARLKCVAAGVAFVLFGCSDIVEVRTGAWWHPWWLLAWKAGCILAFAVLVFDYWRRRRRC